MPITEKSLKRATTDLKFALDDLKEATNHPAAQASDEARAELVASARTRLEAALAALKTEAA